MKITGYSCYFKGQIIFNLHEECIKDAMAFYVTKLHWMSWDGEGGCNFSGFLQVPSQGQCGREYLNEVEAHTQKKQSQPSERAICSDSSSHKQEMAKGRMKETSK